MKSSRTLWTLECAMGPLGQRVQITTGSLFYFLKPLFIISHQGFWKPESTLRVLMYTLTPDDCIKIHQTWAGVIFMLICAVYQMLARSLEQPNNIYGMYFVLVFNNKKSEWIFRSQSRTKEQVPCSYFVINHDSRNSVEFVYCIWYRAQRIGRYGLWYHACKLVVQTFLLNIEQRPRLGLLSFRRYNLCRSLWYKGLL